MEILNLNEDVLSFGWIVTRVDPPAEVATFIAKATFVLCPDDDPSAWPDGPDPLSGDIHWEDDPGKSLRYASDLVPRKPRADLLLVGSARSAGRKISRLHVGFGVGTLAKRLQVFGDRAWRGESPSEPQYLTAVPLRYELAFGGSDNEKNPVGRGSEAALAPNIEDPAHPIRSRYDDVAPAGFGPIAHNWQPRKSLVGTYDDAWLKHRWPGFPTDFDWKFFNAAPADQQVEGYLRGDEELLCENLHPVHRTYRSRLPGLRARCFLDERGSEGDVVFREVPLTLDTLWIDMDAEKLVLVWRGSIEVRSAKLKEVERILVVAEPLSEARTAEHYRKLRGDLLAKEDQEFEAGFAGMDTSAEDAEFELEMTETEKEFTDLEQTLANIEQEPAGIDTDWKAMLIAEGLDPTGIGAESGTPLGHIRKTFAAAMANVRSEVPSDASQPVNPDALLQEIEASVAEMERMEADAAELDREDQPQWTREAVTMAAAHRESFREADLSELDLSELDLSQLDFEGADLAKANLARTKLTRANLALADLSGAELSGADLTEAKLDGADLSKARLQKAAFARASLSDADFSGLDLKDADFTSCSGTGVDFSGCQLSGASFASARLAYADFSGATLEKADFRRAVLESADFENVHAALINMEQADLTGLRASAPSDFSDGNFRRASGNGSLWEEAILDRADFTRAVLARSQFAHASLREARFDRADLTAAVFDDARLPKAILTNANLLRASFERSDLTDAHLEGSNLFESSLREAVLERTNLHGANLKRAGIK